MAEPLWTDLRSQSDLQGRKSVLHRETVDTSLGFMCQPWSSTVGKAGEARAARGQAERESVRETTSVPKLN